MIIFFAGALPPHPRFLLKPKGSEKQFYIRKFFSKRTNTTTLLIFSSNSRGRENVEKPDSSDQKAIFCRENPVERNELR